MEQELRVVVLGWQKSEKALVINSILGKEVESDGYFMKFDKKEGEANGRKISLINTPCWWQIFNLKDSPEVVKQELVCSVFKCPPGPHVFLLVINLSLDFTEENRFSIEKHLGLFGEEIWKHTIVIFTGADSLKEQHIKNQDLQLIIQRCGERYHAFEIENKSDGVQKLLIKIDKLVRANNGKHFETQDDMLLEIKEKREEIETLAKARQEMVQGKINILKEINAVAPLSEVRFVLLGWVLSGKTSTVNTIFNNETSKTEHTNKCTKYSGAVNDRNATVLDTPGWWKYFAPKFNPKYAQASILESISQSQHMKYPHAMILVIPIDTSFKHEQKQIIKEYMAALGENVWKHTIVLFTWGDRFPDISIEQHIETEGEALQWLIEKCRNRYHVFDNTDKNQAQVTELLKKIDEMVAENSLFCLNTECAADVNVNETDTQQDEEISLNADQLLKLMYQELKNRHRERNLQESGTDISEVKSVQSMTDTPELKAEDKLMEKIRREVSRWEAIIRDGMLNNQNPEATCGETVIQRSNEMVLLWLQNSSGYETASERSDLVEDPQKPEMSNRESDLLSA